MPAASKTSLNKRQSLALALPTLLVYVDVHGLYRSFRIHIYIYVYICIFIYVIFWDRGYIDQMLMQCDELPSFVVCTCSLAERELIPQLAAIQATRIHAYSLHGIKRFRQQGCMQSEFADSCSYAIHAHNFV